MGYYTAYTLEWSANEKGEDDLFEELPKDFPGVNYAFGSDGSCIDRVKWYEYETDMKDLSLQYPDRVFTLYGEGEENGDMWYKYFKNGKMQTCHVRMEFDEYDETLLE